MMNTLKHFIIGIAVYCFIGLLGVMTVCRIIEIFALYKADIQIIFTSVLITIVVYKGYEFIEFYLHKKYRKVKIK